MSADQEEIDETEYAQEAIFEQSRMDEGVPLLRSRDSNASLSWRERPSLLWLLPPFFFTATISGAAITPRLSLISDILCQSYYASKMSPGLDVLQAEPVINCNIAVISGQIAKLSSSLNTVTGILSAFTAARYGMWSDRKGRRYPLMIAMTGSFINDLCFILVGSYREHLSIYFLVLGAICDGLSGSFMASMAATYAYTTDVVPPQGRAVAFGYFQCCFFGGIAIGPVLGGYLVRKTDNVLIIFYLAMAVHAIFALYTLFILPESLSESRRELARVKYETQEAAQATRDVTDSVSQSTKFMRKFNVLGPLSVFFPKDGHPIIRRNLKLLMVIDICLLLNMGVFTVMILYSRFIFEWADLEQGYLLSLIGGTRVVVLLGLLPIIVRSVRGKVFTEPHNHDIEHPPQGADSLDIWLIRSSLILDAIGFALMSLAETSGAFYIAGGISALAGIGAPTLASVLTKHVDSTKTGQLLGAVALMQSLNRVCGPLFFGLLYSLTVATHPATCFVLLVVLMSFGLILSMGVRPSTAEHLERATLASEDRHS